MFIVCSGAAAVLLEPERREVAVIEAGGYFGEMSLLTGDARSASVVARGDTTVLELDAELFRALGAADPQGGRADRPGRGDAPRAADPDTRVDPERRRGRCPGDVSGSDEEVPQAELSGRG